MNNTNQELEVKFHLTNLPAFEQKLKDLGARLDLPRIYETNLRFDTADGDLTREYRVLRLRKDSIARLTYKGPGKSEEGVRVRQEIEFTVSDYEAAWAFLNALGYQVSMLYEKYRTTYSLDNVQVVLDEMPYGMFAEIEGPDPASILAVSQRLGLNWEARILESYISLFDRIRTTYGLPFRDLSFANFASWSISLAHMDLLPADG